MHARKIQQTMWIVKVERNTREPKWLFVQYWFFVLVFSLPPFFFLWKLTFSNSSNAREVLWLLLANIQEVRVLY